MKAQNIVIISGIFLVACGGGGGDTPANNNASTLGTVFDTYTELSEANNNTKDTGEITSYILNTNGLKINGTFESGTATWDYYRFYTGTFSSVDVYVFVNGVKQDAGNARISISADNYLNDGYGSYTGPYLNNADVAITGSNQEWYIGITEAPGGNVAGASYTIEIHYNP